MWSGAVGHGPYLNSLQPQVEIQLRHAYRPAAYTMKQIGKYFGVHSAIVSRVIRK